MVLLFKHEHVDPILNGTKIVTRRIWAKGKRAKIGGVHKAKTRLYSREFFARLKITMIYQEALGLMDDADAKLEGYPNLEAFKIAWRNINHIRFNPELVVYVIYFEVVKE
jgi:hypothetical protein